MNSMQLAEASSSIEKNRVAAVTNCLLLASPSSSSSFAHYTLPMLLFTRPPAIKSNFNLGEQASKAARVVRQSIVGPVADCCLGFIQSHPLLNKLLYLPSHFHNFLKIHQRNHNNASFVSSHNFAAILPGDSVAGVVVANGILNFLNIYNTLLICRLVLTWFPNSPPAIVNPLSTLCDPYLNIFRGIIPPLGGTLDLSPILAFLVLNFFTSTAAALPAELPPTVNSRNQFPLSSSNLTSTQQKWTKRLFQDKTKNSSNNN